MQFGHRAPKACDREAGASNQNPCLIRRGAGFLRPLWCNAICMPTSWSRRSAVEHVAVLPRFPETGPGDLRHHRMQLRQPTALIPAEPAWLEDGTLYSARYGDVYASAEGAAAETEHVFLRGNGLPQRWRSWPRNLERTALPL